VADIRSTPRRRYATRAPTPPGARQRRVSSGIAYVGVRIAVYLAALVPIVVIYSTKERALLIAPPIGLIGALATWYFLGDTPVGRGRRALLAGGVGLVLGELTWSLGYWSVMPIVGGAALWLAFYVLSGIAEHGADRTLDRRILLEYCGVALVGVLVVLATAPWRV
jgi:Protein of unknown function (DUF5656)